MAEREMYEFERDWLEKYPYRLSRKFEETLPAFSSRLEAEDYFKQTYGADFIFDRTIEIIDDTVYIYRLIVR